MAKITITTTISPKDHAFCKEKELKWSRLMENAISITRKLYEEGNDSDLLKAYHSKIKKQQETIEKFIRFIEENKLMDNFANFN